MGKKVGITILVSEWRKLMRNFDKERTIELKREVKRSIRRGIRFKELK